MSVSSSMIRFIVSYVECYRCFHLTALNYAPGDSWQSSHEFLESSVTDETGYVVVKEGCSGDDLECSWVMGLNAG